MHKITLRYYASGVLSDTHELGASIIANEKDLEITFGRNKLYEGVLQTFSDTFIFIKAAKRWVDEKMADYETRLDEETKITVELEVQDPVTLQYNTEYSGRIRWAGVEDQNDYTQCEFEDDSIVNRVDKLRKTKLSFEKPGTAYDYPIKLNAALGATSPTRWAGLERSLNAPAQGGGITTYKVATRLNFMNEFVEESKVSENWTRDLFYLNDRVQWSVTPPEETKKVVFRDGFDITVSQDNAQDFYVVNAILRIYLEVETGISYQGSVTVHEELISLAPGQSQSTYVPAGAFADLTGITIDRSDPDPSKWTRLELGFSLEWECPLSVPFEVETAFEAPTEDFGVDYIESHLDMGDTVKTSKIYAIPFSELVADLSAELNLGLDLDALPDIYQNTLVSTSRGLKGFSPMNFLFSFEDFVKSVKTPTAFGAVFEGSDLVWKSMDDIYGADEYHLGEALDQDRKQNGKVINELTYGNAGGGSVRYKHGTQDYNSIRTYAFGTFTDVKKSLATNTFRLDAAALNKAAIDFEELDISSNEEDTDKDVYWIATDPAETEIKSRFQVVSGVDEDQFGNPVNLEFAPSRQFFNWASYLAHLFTAHNSLAYKSHEKNRNLVYTDTDRGEQVVDGPDELEVPVVGGAPIAPLFGLGKFTIEVPYTPGKFSAIKEHANDTLVWTYKGKTYKGFLDSTKLNPIVAEVITLELTESGRA